MSGQSPSRLTVSQRLARRLAEPVDSRARQRAAWRLLDWTGCAVAGSAQPAAAAMRRVRESSRGGALYLGALGNILEMDDVDKRALLHPGPVVMAAAIASADSAEASAFRDSIVRGYEAMIRLGRAVGAAHYRYWHNTGTCGPVGAAAAVASLMRLDVDETATAIELAAAQSSGFWQVRHEPHSFAKQLHTARAADSGVLAAQLAAGGFVGVKTIFEGPQGFFAATCGDADPEAVVANDASDWRIHDVSFKPWPACRHAHAAIDAALVFNAHGVALGDVRRVLVRTYRDAIVFCDKPAPATVIDAKFSLQHSVAVALLVGAPSLGDFELECISSADIATLRSRIDVAEDAAFTSRYPERFGAAIDLALTSGDTKTITIPDVLGDPENPADPKLMLNKARMLMAAGGLSDHALDALTRAALSLDAGGDCAAFRARLFEAVRS